MAPTPLVSIATPVFNGEAFLGECIESVLAQTYPNWEYVVVDNCSTDRSREIAEIYARRDPRIRVQHCTEFVGLVENHNRALSFVSPDSAYCKILSADDWLFPEFVAKTVELAEANPSVGIVSSYQLSGGSAGSRVRWAGLPYQKTVIPGREICHDTLLGGPYVFGVPTSCLYRASLVRGPEPFFTSLRCNADVSSFYEHLQSWDLGFVHQVLSFERIHDAAVTSGRRRLNTQRSDDLRLLLEYGPAYLSDAELARRRDQLLQGFYDLLATGVVNLREREFWSYQKQEIEELGYPFLGWRLARAVLAKITDLALNPKVTLQKALRRAGEHPPSLGDGIG